MSVKGNVEGELRRVGRQIAELGEGPIWHAQEGAWYWFDVIGRHACRIAPGEREERLWPLDGYPGCLLQRSRGGFVLAFRNRITLCDSLEGPFHPVPAPGLDFARERINDGAVDSQGRLWFGTLSPKREKGQCGLYRLDADLSLHRMDEGIDTGNGVAWSPDDRTLYFVDSHAGRVYGYDFDAARGRISRRRVVVDYAQRQGVPDGMTVDSEGRLWVAEVNGRRVACYDPSSDAHAPALHAIELPLSKPTSVAFGGPQLRTLLITTEWQGLTPEQRALEPLAGACFEVRGLAQGLPLPLFAG